MTYFIENGYYVIPNKDLISTTHWKYSKDASYLSCGEMVVYEGRLFEYQYVDGDYVYLTDLGGKLADDEGKEK